MRDSRWLAKEILNQTSDNLKPKIAVGNYFLRWNRSSIGIAPNEENSLRLFVRELVPHISSTIFPACGNFHLGLRQHAKDSRELRHIEEAFNPQVLLSKVTKSTNFLARVDLNGGTVILRRESVFEDAGSAISSIDVSQSQSFFIEWELGELIFDRQGKKFND